MKKPFQNWNMKKHIKFVTAVHAVCYAVDLTLSYYIIKKFIDKGSTDAYEYDLEFED